MRRTISSQARKKADVPRVLVPLPNRDFDVTEVSVPWQILTRRGIEVVFATETGATPAADPLLLQGVLFGQLGAEPEAKAFYRELAETEGFRAPLVWKDLEPTQFDGLLLPGGHAKGMRQYLESESLRKKVFAFWCTRRPVAAICHGVIVLARTTDVRTGRSVLFDRKTTCLPKYMEKTAYYLTRFRLGEYYRTYPEYVEDEVKSVLALPDQFQRGPTHLIAKGTADDDSAAFVVDDGHYVSGRWPGDAYKLGKVFAEKIMKSVARASRPSAHPRSAG
jgi:putative intracellular protease/amidase